MHKNKLILFLVGARPQFIKLAPLFHQAKEHFTCHIAHSGQHHDNNMSGKFFNDLNIPKPNYNLNISGGNHGEQTGKMLIKIERLLTSINPNLLVIFGDTNTTLAGVLASSKLHIPTLHIEAGLRSYDKRIPEEINRITTDHLSTLHACPTQIAINNLKKENITKHICLTGDIMLDAIKHFSKISIQNNQINHLKKEHPSFNFDIPFYFMTMHRPSNVDTKKTLISIFDCLEQSKNPIFFSLHPRTKKSLETFNITIPDSVYLSPPIGYLETITLLDHAKKIITDSGGLQKEAFFKGTPCIIMRDKTEWPEIIKYGQSTLVLNDYQSIDKTAFITELTSQTKKIKPTHLSLYGNGNASLKIINQIKHYFDQQDTI